MEAELHERTRLKECLEALARAQETLLFAFGELLSAAGQVGGLALLFELLQEIRRNGHRRSRFGTARDQGFGLQNSVRTPWVDFG